MFTSVSGLARRQPPEGVPRGRSADLPRALFRVFDGSRLPDHGDPDLTRKAELGLDSLGDVPSHELGRRVVDLLRLDQDPDLAAGLDRIRLLDSLEGVRDLLELLQTLDVSLQ